MNWNTIGPRISAAYDLMGNGQTALKGAAGRYYYVIASGGGVARCGESRTRNYQEQYTWNDANGDRHFQPGEQTGTPVITRVDTSTISFDPDYQRPYTDEYTAGVDHELLPAVRLSVVYTYRREKDLQASSNPAQPVRHVPDDARRTPGATASPARRTTATFQFYNRTSTAVNQTFFTNDRNYLQTYKGLEITAHQADVEPLAGAGRLHVLEVAHRRVERQHEPELPDQCHRPTGRAGEHWRHDLQRPDRRSAAPVQG